MPLYSGELPDFPWDSLIPVRERAAEYPGGAVDLTIGTPVDPVPAVLQEALRERSDTPGYPPTIGTPELRGAIREWLVRRRGVAPVGSGVFFDDDGEAILSHNPPASPGLHPASAAGGVAGTLELGGSLTVSELPGVLPTLGSKEMVALLPALVGLGEGDVVAFPEVAYPTYDVGARLAGATPMPMDTEADPASWPSGISMVWLNSPGNPNGHVLSVDQLRAIVAWAQERGVIVASDECYGALPWDVAEAPSILDARVCSGNYAGLFSLYSLSKQSNLAGYRAAFIAGDPARIAALSEVRKHAGFLMPSPVQHAMAVALGDDEHVAVQREIYRGRRTILQGAVAAAGLEADPATVAGLYLWVRDPSGRADGWGLVHAFAELGIIVAPGDFYGVAGTDRVRISLTATDDKVRQAAERMPELAKILAR
ncbi:MAG: succinyldiaminopimelate transaminase [Ancrocorticia sp.]|uniref:succinyldiaminopimelate transaminase n=1 Tax=Ancrocorticia sp. TaxID=2593684 RepID=UPI003F91C080